MERIKKFEPLFGEWHAEELLRETDSERVYKVYREADGGREYARLTHIPVPNDEEIVAALRDGGMDEQTLSAYSDVSRRSANRRIAMAQRLSGCHSILPLERSETIERESGLGCDVFLLSPLYEDLAQRQARGPLTRDEALALAEGVSSALAACSAQGIVHRNVGPESIFVKPDGKFLLGDLSCARVKGSDDGEPEACDMTYAAPEVFRGEGRSEASDMYSLGLVLYRALNGGRMPFEPKSQEPVTPAQSEAAAMRRIAGAALPAPENADDGLSTIILGALSPDPKGRFPSAAEMNRFVRTLGETGELPTEGAHAEAAQEPVPEPLPEPEPIQEPQPTAKKEKIVPVIGTKAMPVSDEPPIDRKAAKRAEKERRKAEKLAAKAKAQEPEEDEYEDEYDDEYEDEEPERTGRGLKAGIIIAAIVAGLALLGILGVLLKGAIDGIIADREANAFKPKAPDIVRDSADPDLYRITIYAENGSTVVYERLSGTRTEYTVNSDNRIVFELRGSDLVPDEPIDSTAYSVQPKFYTRNEANELVPISDMGFIMIDIPQLEVTLGCPDTIETDTGAVRFEGRISRPDANLTIDGQPVETAIDGSFAFEKQFEENGEYTIELEAKLPKYAIWRKTLNVAVDVPEPPTIMLPWDMGETGFSQRVTDPAESVTVHGTVPEGMRLEVVCANELVALTEPEVGEDGSFSFTATLPEIGDYAFELNCLDENGLVSTRELHLQRAPEWKPYVESAWAMSYEALTKASSQCYNIKGTVTEIIEKGDRYLVALETEGGTVLLEYYHHYPTANSFEVGRQYNWIYGFPMGRNEEGAPVVYVWFVNDK